VEGRRAYKAARAGQTLEMPPRQVDIQRLELVSYTPPHELVLDVDCSKGTYIRSLAHDIGQQLGCGAYLSALRRTRIGTFRLEDALTPEQFAERVKGLAQV
jgi:tRNA pseudouridine55 synthase